MTYAIVRTDKMFGTQNKAGLTHLKYFVGDTPTAIQNGSFVAMNGLMTGKREVFKAVAPTASTDLKNILLVATPEMRYDKNYYDLNTFTNEAGEIARGYYLHTGDIFSLTDEGIDGTAAVGKFLVLQAGVMGKIADAEAAGTTTIGKIIAIEVIKGVNYNVVQVA